MSVTESTEFRAALNHVAKHGYADPNAKISRPADGSHDLVIDHQGYRFHDNWFGSEPFGGREVVSKDGKVLWMMTYFGALVDTSADIGDTYGIGLKEAMRQPAEELPVRGPRQFTASNGYKYSFEWNGNLDRFVGVEKISNAKGEVVYVGEVSGGLVDEQH